MKVLSSIQTKRSSYVIYLQINIYDILIYRTICDDGI